MTSGGIEINLLYIRREIRRQSLKNTDTHFISMYMGQAIKKTNQVKFVEQSLLGPFLEYINP